jgi:acyl-CoA dehydrogenase
MSRQKALRWRMRELAEDFRTHALDLDRDPDRVTGLLGLPGVRYLSTLGVPAEFGGTPLRIGRESFDGMTAEQRVVIFEEFARVDAGIALAAPGPSMFGVLMERLGDRSQREAFYGRILAAPTWTCFALTEPSRGSDAGNLATQLEQDGDGYRLSGAKRFIGNACRASEAVVLARTRPGPLGVTAAWVDPADPGFKAEALPMLGLKALQVGSVSLEGVVVRPGRVLGAHLSPAQRGIWSCVQVFNRLRPAVAAIALGIAAAAVDCVRELQPRPGAATAERLAELDAHIASVRALVVDAARAVDATGDGRPASAAKARACELAEDATLEAAELLGPSARTEIPMLDKLLRDARGIEFMEGTRNIQWLNLLPALRADVGEFTAGSGKSAQP